MARSRRSAPAPARKAPAPAKAPAPVQAAPAPAPAVPSAPAPSMGGGLMATVAEGMAFGTGSAIARHAVNSVVDSFGGSDDKAGPAPVAAAPALVAAAAAPAAAMCLTDKKAFLDCLDRSTNDISACQFYLDALNTCKQQSAFL